MPDSRKVAASRPQGQGDNAQANRVTLVGEAELPAAASFAARAEVASHLSSPPRPEPTRHKDRCDMETTFSEMAATLRGYVQRVSRTAKTEEGAADRLDRHTRRVLVRAIVLYNQCVADQVRGFPPEPVESVGELLEEEIDEHNGEFNTVEGLLLVRNGVWNHYEEMADLLDRLDRRCGGREIAETDASDAGAVAAEKPEPYRGYLSESVRHALVEVYYHVERQQRGPIQRKQLASVLEVDVSTATAYLNQLRVAGLTHPAEKQVHRPTDSGIAHARYWLAAAMDRWKLR